MSNIPVLFAIWIIAVLIFIVEIYEMNQTLSMSARPHGSSDTLTIYSNSFESNVFNSSGDDDCPDFFDIPHPNCKVGMWRYLRSLGFEHNGVALHCDQQNCSKCIPPNSISPELNTKHETWYTDTYSNQKGMRQQYILDKLQANGLQSRHDGDHSDYIILLVFNYGFAHLFLNWVCSLDYNHISYLRSNTLVVVSDTKSKLLAQQYNFTVVLDINDVTNVSALDITEEASKSFPADSFKPLVTFQMIILSDLIHLGYDVMMMDVDVIFNRDPLKYVAHHLYKWVDVWTQVAPRFDYLGSANTGVIFMKSNCKTKIFMETIMKHITIVWRQSDQAAFNFFLNWKPFRQITFKFLARKLFLGGPSVALDTKPADIERYNDFVLFHASWTRGHYAKIIKFHTIDHWYFTKDKCDHMFNASFIPDLKDRVKDMIFDESSGYLLEHRLITDKSNMYGKHNKELIKNSEA